MGVEGEVLSKFVCKSPAAEVLSKEEEKGNPIIARITEHL